MERVEIRIEMRMLSDNDEQDVYDTCVRAITRLRNINLQRELREAIFSIIENEEDEQYSRFLFGEVCVNHKDESRVYLIGNAEFMMHYQQEGIGETYH